MKKQKKVKACPTCGQRHIPSPAIVKIQISLNDGGQRVVIYDEPYTWGDMTALEGGHFYEGPNTSDVKQIMSGRIKAFFWAFLHPREGGGFDWEIDMEAPWQEW